jgi:mannose-6-phosphate isomerase-like protein (cupin superfamily)
MDMSVQIEDLELLDAIQDFALSDPDPRVQKFSTSLREWGQDWIETTPAYLPAADFLADAISVSTVRGRQLLASFEQHKSRLRWEQSYRKQDGLVPQAMLDGYGFAEIIGQQGPFVSDRIRAGVGVWGPGIVYPRHQHLAEEVYIVLSGSAEFKVGDSAGLGRGAGEVVFVESNAMHGFRTTDQALVVYYLWQAGDLRQVSRFA